MLNRTDVDLLLSLFQRDFADAFNVSFHGTCEFDDRYRNAVSTVIDATSSFWTLSRYRGSLVFQVCTNTSALVGSRVFIPRFRRIST